jgi:hypothetical protein
MKAGFEPPVGNKIYILEMQSGSGKKPLSSKKRRKINYAREQC